MCRWSSSRQHLSTAWIWSVCVCMWGGGLQEGVPALHKWWIATVRRTKPSIAHAVTTMKRLQNRIRSQRQQSGCRAIMPLLLEVKDSIHHTLAPFGIPARELAVLPGISTIALWWIDFGCHCFWYSIGLVEETAGCVPQTINIGRDPPVVCCVYSNVRAFWGSKEDLFFLNRSHFSTTRNFCQTGLPNTPAGPSTWRCAPLDLSSCHIQIQADVNKTESVHKLFKKQNQINGCRCVSITL